ncbi:glycoside hydrolase family 88/105 protein [Anaerotalea alkaliphila]|uniref:Glycosyl hydrolase family 88 n=1 Tax=Anaerotalea alkaliphila TaxID=2662126 RepID=A0A7X5KMV1_9FIRM|nr:glycoside hydrolase family 88 protein [Anaerotalea alkaliphila]NDL67083.1 glycosyl hydrolase family 88 [Anaerotalea alkaliphila]
MNAGEFADWYLSRFKSYKEHWNYEDGCVLKGAADLYDATGEGRYLDFVKGYIDERIDEDGNIRGFDFKEYNIDNVNTGKLLLYLHETTGEEKYAKAAVRQYQQLLHHPRTEEGNFWHKNIYPNQVWLDGLYMAMPFYAGYLRHFEPDVGYWDVLRQFKTVQERMRDPKTGLYYHGYDASRKERWSDPETGLSPHFWSRAMGWFLMSLVDTAEMLGDAPGAELLKAILSDAVEAMMRVQDPESKMWYQVLDRGEEDGNYLETSGTLMTAYAFLKGARIGLLDPSYGDEGAAVFNEVAATQLDGEGHVLGGICGVAGLGNEPYRDGTYAYYISERPIPNDHKGVGAFLMTYAEQIRYNNDNWRE